MASSGTITGSTSNSYIKCEIRWTQTREDQYNRSKIKAYLFYKRTDSSYKTYGTFVGQITVGSYTKSISKYIEIQDDWVAVGLFKEYISHQDDGTLALTISATGSISGTTLTSTSCSELIHFDTIQRASTISYASNTTLGGRCLVRWTPPASGYKYKLRFSLGDWSKTTGYMYGGSDGGTSPVEWEVTIPLEVANHISATAKTDTMYVELSTYTSDGLLVGDVSTQSFTVTIPDNADTQPTVGMSLASSSTLSSPYNGMYIQGLSKVKATLDPKAKYGATIVASSITVDGNTYVSPYESGILSQAGKVTVKATVKDSRGFYGTYYKDIEVLHYSKPYIRAKSGETSIIAARCNASADFTDSGTYLKIKAKVVYSKVEHNGVQNNYAVIKFRYREEGGAYGAWQTILTCKTDNSDEVITPPLLNGALDAKLNYQVQIIATDDLFDSEPITIAVPSDKAYMHKPAGGKSMGLGGYSQGDGNLDVYWKIMARGGLSMLTSAGDEVPFSAEAALIPRNKVPEGWNPDNMMCGIYAVTNDRALKAGDGTAIMEKGILLQIHCDQNGDAKLQLALPVDVNSDSKYRIYWYDDGWTAWRSFKL